MRAAYLPLPCESPAGAYPFMPFQPRWLAGLDLHNRGVFSALLELSWCQSPPCYLPADPEMLRAMLMGRYTHPSWSRPIPTGVLARFKLDQRSGKIFFPPLLHAYRFMKRSHSPEAVLQLRIV